MAVWQFKIGLIPRAWAEAQHYSPDRLLDDSGEGMSDAWDEHPLEVDVAAVIETEFPAALSWSEHLRCWGDETSNDIQIWSFERPIEEIWIRIDLRISTELAVEKAVRIAKQLDCVFFALEKRLIVPARESVLRKMINSSVAANYVKTAI